MPIITLKDVSDMIYKEYYFSGLMMSIIACLGSPLSLINLIPLISTYQLIQKAKEKNLPDDLYKRLSFLFYIAVTLTLMSTFLYLSLQW